MPRKFEAKTLADEMARLDEQDSVRAAISVERRHPDYSQVYREMHQHMERIRREYPGYGQPLA